MSDQPTTVHRTPVGCASSVPCCGQQVFDLPHTDRMTTDGDITCGGTATRTDQLAEIRAELGPADWPSEILRLRAENATLRLDVATLGDEAHQLGQTAREGERQLAQARTAAPSITVDDLAQLIHAADVHVNDGHYPAWDDLSTTPGLGQDDVRKAARWLLERLSIAPRHAPADPCLAEPVHQAGCPAA